MSGPLSGQGVVVTGAGHGIGRALATRMAAGGARVVVNDLDAGAAMQVAAAIGGYAAPGDAASEQGVAALVAAAREHLGQIDIWFANAGIDRGHGLDASEADWAAAIRRWKKQLDASYSRDLPPADELHGRLAANVPAESAAAGHYAQRLAELRSQPGMYGGNVSGSDDQ